MPDGTDYRLVGSSNSSKSKTWSTGIDLSIENLAGDGRPVTIHIHQTRNDLDQYHVTVNGVLVARATRFKAGAQTKFSSWQIEVAKGFDLALVCCTSLRVDIKQRSILYEHHVDLLTGFCHRQNTGLAPVTRSWVKKEIRHSDDYKAQKVRQHGALAHMALM